MSAEPRFDLSAREQALLEQAEVLAAETLLISGGALSREALLQLFAKLEPLGYLASVLPTTTAPRAPGALAFAALVEGLSPALPLLGNHSVQRYLHEFGSADQKRRFLPPLLAGEAIAGIAITEPQAGADLNLIETGAIRHGDGYILSGVKTWVTHGLVADLFIVLAKTEAGLTRFVVPGNAPGLSRRALTPIGLGHITFAELRFERCELSPDLMLGAEGRGGDGAKSAFPIARALAALQAVRLGEAALAVAVGFARDRTLFNRRLAESALVQDQLADHQAQLTGARLIAYQCMLALDAPAAGRRAAAAKASGCRAALDACHWAMELLGSAGLLGNETLERLHGDARMMSVVDGTIALNRFVVARQALKDQ